jgi:hypothetical protein
VNRNVRLWVVLACAGVVLLSLFAYFSRGNRGSSTPKEAENQALVSEEPSGVAEKAGQAGGVEVSGSVKMGRPKELEPKERKPAKEQQKWDPEIWGILPPKSRVMLEDGSIVPAKPGRSKLGDPGVIAEIYDGAPEVAVKRLKGILLSGSNEYAEFTKTEKYPEWVYDEIERRYPGDLGVFLAHIARGETTMPPLVRPSPPLDIGEEGQDPYRILLIGHPGEVAVAETKYGTVGAEVHLAGNDVFTVAAFLAHRIAAGDTEFHVPKVPPPAYKRWLDWIEGSFEPWRLKKEFADAGITLNQVSD